jgi:hypothetical protein
VSKFQTETRAILSESTLIQHLSKFLGNKKRRGVECIYLSEAFDCPQRINTNNSRPKRPYASGILQKQYALQQNDATIQKPVADVSVRPIPVVEIVEVSDRE